MGSFGTAVRYLDWVKSRQASLLEAKLAPVPFTKYYNIESSRQFKKIPYVLIIPKHSIKGSIDAFQYYPRLTFQYNITLPFSSYVIKLLNYPINKNFFSVVNIKWIDINTGAVSRYALQDGFIHGVKISDKYNNQKIPTKFSIEFWLGSSSNTIGLNDDMHLMLSLITNPLFPEELERDIIVDGPYDFTEFSWNTPFNVPQINNIVPWPIPDINTGVEFLTDENGNFITDENGNFIII